MDNRYKCKSCPYCKRTTDFYVCWCAYYNRAVYLTDGCDRDG